MGDKNRELIVMPDDGLEAVSRAVADVSVNRYTVLAADHLDVHRLVVLGVPRQGEDRDAP